MVQLHLGYIFEFDPTGITNAPDLSTADMVHDYFGYGTWEAYGAGRATIGVSSGHGIGSEGGEEIHLIAAKEISSLDMAIYVNSNTNYPIGCWNTTDGTYEFYSAEVTWGKSVLTRYQGAARKLQSKRH